MRSARLGVFLSGAVLVAAVSVADGGYFRGTWLWITLALCSLAGIVLLLREPIELGKLEPAEAAVLAAVIAWTALSATWSSAPDDSLQDAERGLTYLAALLAFVLLVDRETVQELLGGVALGVVLVSGFSFGQRLLATGTIPTDPVSGARLTEPLGYANALGALVAIGILLALGLVVYARTGLERSLSCAALPLLLPTLALTQSRGAVLALGAGLAVWALIERRRPELVAAVVVLSLPCAVAVLVTLDASALTDPTATAHEVSAAGRQVATVVGISMLAAGVASLLCDPLARRLSSWRLTWIVPATFALALGGIVGLAVLGVDRTLGPRVDYWRVAWHEFEQNRWLGSGAATFSLYWDKAGRSISVLDAHSLYLETLAELGLVGLVLLSLALVLPLGSARMGLDQPLAAVATSAYVIFLVHTGLDWDWEMPAVTLTGILGAVALLVVGRGGRMVVEVGLLGRSALAAAVAMTAILALALRLLSGQ
jgi:O-antigen ligase